MIRKRSAVVLAQWRRWATW